ncbi:sulfite exporter TauE/SafE family protein [Thermococcus sp.]
MIFILLTGVVAGLALGALGSAWGAITVPLLLISGMPPMTTKGVVLSSEVVVSGLGVASHAKMRNVKKELSMALVLGIAGAILGSYLSENVPAGDFKAIVGVYEIFAGVVLLMAEPRSIINVESNTGLGWAVLVGLLAGFVKGFLGTGWGPVGVTLLLILGALPKTVVGSSLLARIAISGSAAAYYAARGYFTATSTILLVAGGLMGVLIGAYSTKFMKEEHMRKTMGLLVLALGVVLLIKIMG